MRPLPALLIGPSLLLLGASARADEPAPARPSTPAEAAPQAKPTATGATEGKPPALPPVGAFPPAGELPPISFDGGHKLEVEIHGFLQLWFFQPLTKLDPPRLAEAPLGPDDRLFEVYQASVGVTGKYGDFSVHVNPHFRDTKVREFYTSNVWLQQAYGSYQSSGVKVSAGKIENQLSVLDDDSFYLNLPYFDGIKYESDYGLSVEGAHDLSEAWSLHYTGQYFVTDGHTNGSLRDRDTVWVDGGHRRHIAVARVDPGYRFSPTTSLRFGVAAQVAAVDLGSGANDPVLRLDGDFSFVTGPVRLFGEAIFQLGQTVTRYPLEAKGNLSSRASSRNLYAVAGGGVRIWRFYPRYSVSLAQYADVGVTEMTHVPAVSFLAHEHMTLMLEYGYWPRYNPTRTLLYDNSLNFVILGKF